MRNKTKRPQNGRKYLQMMWPNKGLISKIYKQLIQLNIKKKNHPIKKMVRRSKQISPKMRDDHKYMKRCPTLQSIREMPVKTTMRYHLTPVRMAIITKSTNNKCWTGCGEKGTLLQCWWKCKLVQPLWRTVWRFLRKLKIELPEIYIHPQFIATLYMVANTGK